MEMNTIICEKNFCTLTKSGCFVFSYDRINKLHEHPLLLNTQTSTQSYNSIFKKLVIVFPLRNSMYDLKILLSCSRLFFHHHLRAFLLALLFFFIPPVGLLFFLLDVAGARLKVFPFLRRSPRPLFWLAVLVAILVFCGVLRAFPAAFELELSRFLMAFAPRRTIGTFLLADCCCLYSYMFALAFFNIIGLAETTFWGRAYSIFMTRSSSWALLYCLMQAAAELALW